MNFVFTLESIVFIILLMSIPRPFDRPIPKVPRDPFPILTEPCDIVAGYGRGSSELGFPTVNVPIEQLPKEVNDLELGVYFGYALLKPVLGKEDTMETNEAGRELQFNHGRLLDSASGDLDVLPVVLSVGMNPFYHNKYKTVELHLLHEFKHNFYGAQIKFNILGYIRPELDYTTVEALINDINKDIVIARTALESPEYSSFMTQLIPW